jgi:hypothetical protein
MEYKAVRTEVVMRFLSFKTGLLLVLLPAGAAFAAEGQQQDDKSYLPPPSYIAAPSATPAANSTQAAFEPAGRRARVAPRRHEARHRSYARRTRPIFFFPF